MQYAQMVCATSANIGDDIQSIAAAQFLPRVDLFVDRERLPSVSSPSPVSVIMNGWFMHTDAWPPSSTIRPAFVSFHVTPEKRELIARHAAYLKQFEPIGARDKGTAEFLQSLGVRSTVTYCMTLTFPRRERAPVNGRVAIVDARPISIPKALRRGAVNISHTMRMFSDATKLQHARELLKFYRDEVSLVITSRLHCALPCMAMGIPVVFFGDPSDFRTSIVQDVGGRIYNLKLHARSLQGLPGRIIQPVDWSPPPIDLEAVKAALKAALEEKLEAV